MQGVWNQINHEFDQYLALSRNWCKIEPYYYGRWIGNRTQVFEWYQFEWPWVTLSDLAKYSVTRSVARSLCDSWASCLVPVLALISGKCVMGITHPTTPHQDVVRMLDQVSQKREMATHAHDVICTTSPLCDVIIMAFIAWLNFDTPCILHRRKFHGTPLSTHSLTAYSQDRIRPFVGKTYCYYLLCILANKDYQKYEKKRALQKPKLPRIFFKN